MSISKELKKWCYRELIKLKSKLDKEELKYKIKKLKVNELLDLNIVIRKINKKF